LPVKLLGADGEEEGREGQDKKDAFHRQKIFSKLRKKLSLQELKTNLKDQFNRA
jgi:hypothetical protein